MDFFPRGLTKALNYTLLLDSEEDLIACIIKAGTFR
jgi:hypothetical protein